MSENKSNSSTNTSDAHLTPSRRRFWIILVAVTAVVLGFGGMTAYAYTQQAQTVLKNTTIGSYPIGGLDSLSALNELQSQWQQFTDKAFIFAYQDQLETIPISGSATKDEEVILSLASFDPEAAVNTAYDYGHTGPTWQQAWERLLAFLGQRRSVNPFALSNDGLKALLKERFGASDTAAVNAGIAFDENDGVTITPSQNGSSIDYDGAIRQAINHIQSLDPSPITLRSMTTKPAIPTSPALPQIARDAAPGILDRAPLKLEFGEQSWEISRAQLADLLGFIETSQGVSVGFDPVKTAAWLDLLRADIDVEPRDAKFNVIGGRVEEFQTSVVGRRLNDEKTVQSMQVEIFNQGLVRATAVVDETLPLTDTVSTNDLGIRELVGEGSTDFRGSPRNRVYNLELGAERINGLILKPGETFSLVTALGQIDKEHGWKPELVIKGSDITPEFGGGLCQVATTLFRAVLNTGLKVVERHNHSLRVSYYEPPVGLDATIYEPKPDLRFTNDYDTALLIQTRVEGTKLIFSFYGTKDGRTVDLPTPTVYNKTPIPPTETHETDELAPGEEECQNGHPGADATVTYTVTKADGTSESQTFNSHYRALAKICRVGKQPATQTN